MRSLFGTRVDTAPLYGVQVQTSISTNPIPIVYGQRRVAPNLIWYGDFKQTSSGKSGKGGKGGGGPTYATSLIMALCEGPIDDVVAVWANNTYEQIHKAGWKLIIGGGSSGATCSFNTDVMTCSTPPTSGSFSVGQTISAPGLSAGISIESLGTGLGGVGTYNITPITVTVNATGAEGAVTGAKCTFSGTTMTCLTAPSAGSFSIGDIVSVPGYPLGATILSFAGYQKGYINSDGQLDIGGIGSYILSAPLVSYSLGSVPTTGTQAPWIYMTTNHPDQARGYPNTAYVCAANYPLDSSAQLPNHTFEVAGLCQYTPHCGNTMAVALPSKWLSTSTYYVGGVVYAPQGGTYLCIGTSHNNVPPNATYWTQIFPDANPADILNDLITNTVYGACIPSLYVDVLSGSQYSKYCIAMGLFLSMEINSSESINQIVQRTMEITNSEVFWSDCLIKVAPRGDTVVTGNGITFTPNITPVYDLTDDNFIVASGAEPVSLNISDVIDAFNTVTVNFNNRLNHYNSQPVQVKDQASIDVYGLRVEGAQSHPEICDPSVAKTVAQLRLQRIQKGRNVYSFTLPITFCVLEPMDIVTLTDIHLGLNRTAVRLISVDEDEWGNLSFTAEELMEGAAHPALFDMTEILGYAADYNSPPPNTNTPIFYVPSVELAKNKLTAYILASGGVGWGGCQVWASNDGNSYKMVGSINGGLPMGTLTTNIAAGDDPDTTNTLSVDLTSSNGYLLSATQGDADRFSTLCYVDGELMSYETAILTAPHKYDLKYLRRGLYGSGIKSHLSGSQFGFVNGNQLELDFTSAQIGKPIYIKLPSVNYWDAGLQNLADISPFTFTVTSPAPSSTSGPFGISTILLPAPSSVKVFATPDTNGTVSRVRVQFKLDITQQIPDTFYLMVAATDTANQIKIGQDLSTSLEIHFEPSNFLSSTIAITGRTQGSGGDLALSTPFHAVAGSTRSYLKVSESPLPQTVSLGGKYWGQFGASQWRKVSGYDTDGFYFNEPFDIDPVPGDVIQYVEISWFDERTAYARLAAIQVGSQVEIVRWGSVVQNGGTISIGGLKRAQELTSKITNASGGTFTYFPAPGNGTQVITFNSANKNADGSFTCETDVNINIKHETFISMSAATTMDTKGGLMRSPIVPATYGGSL
jgi:hypothetical protein